jgi:1-aminocyclopropane-1-carboxylate synthase
MVSIHNGEMQYLSIFRVKPVYVSFGDTDQFSIAAVEKYEKAILKAREDGTHIRAMMLCNPHNPLGQCYPHETIIAIMKLCNKYQIHLISDEIYALSVYDIDDKEAVPFESVFSFDSSEYINPDYLHLLYGMSKDLAGGGMRIGCLLTRNKELMRALSSITQFHWTNEFAQNLAIMMLEDDKWMDEFLRTSRKRLAHLNKLTRRVLDEAGIKYSHGSNAGFFMWVDLRPYLPEAENGWVAEGMLLKKMMDCKVFLTNGGGQHAEQPGYFRLIFSQPEPILKEGLKRLLKALKGEDIVLESLKELSI